jgi:sulfur relay (sulfurtransferase) DsrC/TusE family protein
LETETYETETENNETETETEIVRYVIHFFYAFYTGPSIAMIRMTGIKSTKLSVGRF